MMKHGNPENQAEEYSRFGLHGDFPTRAMMWALRTFPRMPRFVEAGLLYLFSAIVLVLAGPQRRGIQKNLSAVMPDLGGIESYAMVFRVFVNFGWTYIDGLRARLGQEVVTWEIEGKETFDMLQGGTEAALIMTTHTGNYDLAAAIFSGHFGRTLHTVRIPEKEEHMEEMRRKELADDTRAHSNFKIHYNESQGMLGVELAKLLSEGELVAIQCDRVIGEVSAIEAPAGGDWKIRVPKGPMTLAAMTKCPCVPLFVVRAGYRNYRIIFEKPLEIPADRRVREKGYAAAWAGRLVPFLERYGTQWFAFEEAFTKTQER